jgi:hypothetical protein
MLGFMVAPVENGDKLWRVAVTNTTPLDSTILTIRIKSLEWTDKSGSNFRRFSAETSYGEFVYGTDFGGQAYHQGLDLEGFHEEADHPSEESAKVAAEASHARLAIRDILALSNPSPPPKAELKEAKVVAELRDVLVKYADDWEEARSWGGPTIEPRFPLDEGSARKIGARLASLERELST